MHYRSKEIVSVCNNLPNIVTYNIFKKVPNLQLLFYFGFYHIIISRIFKLCWYFSQAKNCSTSVWHLLIPQNRHFTMSKLGSFKYCKYKNNNGTTGNTWNRTIWLKTYTQTTRERSTIAKRRLNAANMINSTNWNVTTKISNCQKQHNTVAYNPLLKALICKYSSTYSMLCCGLEHSFPRAQRHLVNAE